MHVRGRFDHVGRTSIRERIARPSVSRVVVGVRSFRRCGTDSSGRISAWILRVTIGLGCLGIACIARADNPVITIDNEFLNDTRLTSGLLVAGPPEVAREMAIVGGAMFDAANAASGLTFSTVAYGGGAVPGVSVDAAALSAGYTALQGIFANSIWSGTGGSLSLQTQVLSDINATYTAALNGLGLSNVNSQCANPSGGLLAVCGGIVLGTKAGNANLTARGYTVGNNQALATDGSSTAILAGINNPYTPANTNPGTYIPPTTRVAMFPTWGTVAPSGLTTGQLTELTSKVPGPPAVTSALYATNLLQTECEGSGNALPARIGNVCAAAGFAPESTAQARAALFWNDPGTTMQPPGHWLDITDSLVLSQSLSTLQAARLAALVGEAESDAGIAAWDVKYQDNLWRPITAIQDCADWNANFTTCDPAWVSLITTPPHPDYLAGHPAFSGAAATVLKAALGDVPVTSTSDAYCNAAGSTPVRSIATNLIVACTVPGTASFAFNSLDTIYSTPAGCTDAGGVLGTNGTLTTCTIGSVTYTYNPGQTGCNDIVNGGANDSPLICPITETFATITDASSGPNGAEFSRVAGGIHTPFAVVDALNLGDQIGQVLADENNIPEPGAIGILAAALALLSGPRWYRSARARRRGPAAAMEGRPGGGTNHAPQTGTAATRT